MHACIKKGVTNGAIDICSVIIVFHLLSAVDQAYVKKRFDFFSVLLKTIPKKFGIN